MEQIESYARASVARGSAFGLLAIVCTMVGLSGTPILALKIGGMLCLMASFILILKAVLATRRPYKRTEVWLMLDPLQRPPATVAQRIIGNALREAFQDFARHFARAAAASLGASLVVGLI
jgi:hypothetical protein